MLALSFSTTIIAGFLSLMIVAIALIFYFRKNKAHGASEQFSLCMQESLGVVTDAVVIVNASGMIQYVNGSAETLLLCEQRSVLGKNFWSLYELLNGTTKKKITNLLEGVTKRMEQDYSLLLQDKKPISTHIIVTPVNFLSTTTENQSYALVIQDISRSRLLESKLTFLESSDQLTHLPNRKAIEVRLTHALADARKHTAKHVLCYISLDKIKNVSDMSGHAAVEALTVQLVSLLRRFVPNKNDVLARVGGDDFAILYREQEAPVVLKIAEAMREAIQKFVFKWNGEEHQVTASIGLLLIHQKTTANAVGMLSDADIASRIARSKGGNRIVPFNPKDQAVTERKGNLNWIKKIKEALEQNRFRLVSQPIHPIAFSPTDMPFFHYETLIRLFDEEGNFIPPDEFLPAAEQHGMMMEIDKWVIHEAFRNLQLIKQKNPLPVFSINLSGQSVNESKFLDFVLNEMKTMRVNPKMICFEITESVAVDSMDKAMKFMNTFKDLGCSFSLDDFGTGISSYAYLKKLPVDYLKIDGVFVKDMVNDEISQEMVRSINQVGHVMGLEIIAEYVENDEIIAMLNEIGVDYGQGYGISRPLPIDEVVNMHQMENAG